MAAPQKLLLTIIFFIAIFILSGNLLGVHGSSHRLNSKPTKLFVFGDSYVDTGNSPKSSSSWMPPYGITFPGKPSGRNSDGRVWSDYFAKFYGLKSPIPYELSNDGANDSEHGMNFAYAGTGVFDTLNSTSPNMTIQIDYLERLIKKKVYNHTDLESSVALVAVSGNDYVTFLVRNGTNATGLEWLVFITKVVNQIVVDLKRIQALGVKKIAVDGLHPVGCIPFFASVHSFTYCNNTLNILAHFHNFLLKQEVATLNETKDATFIYLDLYTAFDTILENHERHQGRNEFVNTLNPCCKGTSSKYSCGSVDANGVKQYTVCEQPDSSFFWDMVHPTQAGWRAVAKALLPSLRQL